MERLIKVSIKVWKYIYFHNDHMVLNTAWNMDLHSKDDF